MTDQRKTKRFDLRLPLELLRGGRLPAGKPCETKNLSSGGVLFRSAEPIEVGELIEYRITFPPKTGGDAKLQLRCRGKVLRLQANGSGATSIAATLERYEFVRA